MRSQIFRATVFHRRLMPIEHEFSYRQILCALDLDELTQIGKSNPLFGYNRWRPLSIHDDDYLAPDSGPLKAKILDLLRTKPYAEDVERVTLVTCARFLGYAFNPVSFFYCYDKMGKTLAVVAEVNNTFGQRHQYILDDKAKMPGRTSLTYRAGKEFHVSPFNERDGYYEFFFSDLREGLRINVDLYLEGVAKMRTALTGRGESFTTVNLRRRLLRDPLGTLLTVPRIHWEALKLYFRKKLPVFSTPPLAKSSTVTHRGGLVQRLAQSLLTGTFQGIQRGCLTLRLPDGRVQSFRGPQDGPEASLQVLQYDFFKKVVLHGDIGFGEAFTDELVDTDDMTSVLRLFLLNRASADRRHPLFSYISRTIAHVAHKLRVNDRAGSRANIAAHYDLSNELFSLFLDSTMSYSSGLFEEKMDSLAPCQALKQSQMCKLDAVLEACNIQADGHLLDIGCGWGSLAIRAAQRIGCRVTGITLSQEQLEFAEARIRKLGLESQVELKICDYRDLEGSFDAITSVEMIEAVGQEHHHLFLQACDQHLKPGGRAVIQAITMEDESYERYLNSSDWIQKYIFPGGCLISLSRLQEQVSRETGLSYSLLRRFGTDYARTLKIWRDRFLYSHDEVEALGFDRRFQRTWLYYLSYCEAGFLSGPLDVVQFRLEKSHR